MWHCCSLTEPASLSDDVQCFPGTREFISMTQMCCCTWIVFHGCKNDVMEVDLKNAKVNVFESEVLKE